MARQYLNGLAAPPPGPDVAAHVLDAYRGLLAGRGMPGGRPLRVTFTDTDPYSDGRDPSGDPDFESMRHDVLHHGHLYVYALGTSPTLDASVNRAQRVVHDVCDHVLPGLPFGAVGELRATAVAVSRCPALAEFLCSEIAGQALAYLHTGAYPQQRIVAGAERAFAAAHEALASRIHTGNLLG